MCPHHVQMCSGGPGVKSPSLVTATVLEIFQPHLWSKVLVLVTTTVLEIFYQHFVTKSPSFGHNYSTRNILPTFGVKSPSFCHSYSIRNILPTFGVKSPSFCHIYSNHEGARHWRKPLGRRKGFNIFITLGLTKIF